MNCAVIIKVHSAIIIIHLSREILTHLVNSRKAPTASASIGTQNAHTGTAIEH